MRISFETRAGIFAGVLITAIAVVAVVVIFAVIYGTMVVYYAGQGAKLLIRAPLWVWKRLGKEVKEWHTNSSGRI